MKRTNIKIVECVEGFAIKIKITGVFLFTLRLKVAIFFIKLGAKLMPLKTTIEIERE